MTAFRGRLARPVMLSKSRRLVINRVRDHLGRSAQVGERRLCLLCKTVTNCRVRRVARFDKVGDPTWCPRPIGPAFAPPVMAERAELAPDLPVQAINIEDLKS